MPYIADSPSWVAGLNAGSRTFNNAQAANLKRARAEASKWLRDRCCS